DPQEPAMSPEEMEAMQLGYDAELQLALVLCNKSSRLKRVQVQCLRMQLLQAPHACQATPVVTTQNVVGDIKK
ncbi:hypothetical protein NDU88_004051, partial [Pleurodeles waltl]